MSSPIPSLNTSTESSSPAASGHLPPRKRARTEAEKEQRRVERIIRNRKAAHASREKKRKHVEQLESYVKLLESNLSGLFENQKLLYSMLESSGSNMESIKLVEKIQRPVGLALSDEESDHSNNTNSQDDTETKGEEPESPSLQKENKKSAADSNVNLQIDQLSWDFDQKNELDSQAELDLLSSFPLPSLVSSNGFSSLPSSTSSPSVVSSDLSNPSTPVNGDEMFPMANTNDFGLFSNGVNPVMDLNTYLEPDLSAPNEIHELDQSLDFKSNEILNNNKTINNNNIAMGCLGLFNSVHSAVMHTVLY